MKNFTKKSILQKIIITMLTVLLLMNFIIPNVSKAEAKEVGGVLLKPVTELLIVAGDAIMYIANVCAGDNDWPVASFERRSFTGMFFGNSIEIPKFKVSPEKIFQNEVELLDVDIINADENGDSIASKLKGTISSWYISIRNLAVVGLLSVLVYISIRVIISSTATDKSKYKQMLLDWLVALCLVFFMHYIMSFAITMVNTLTQSIRGRNQKAATSITVDDLKEEVPDQEILLEQYVQNNNLLVEQNFTEEEIADRGLERRGLALDFTSYSRVMAENTGNIGQRFGYIIIYLVFVIYTIMFLIVYIKRLIYIIFLTLIAPLVALTYPIDKITDGKAQGFSTWLKEYIFNLLLQPVHLILYTLLIGTAMEIAQEYMIYALVVLGFMLPAEKIVRKLFGFEKSSTASSIVGGALGGALAMQGIQGLSKVFGKSKGKSNLGASGKDKANDKVRMANRGVDNPAEEDDFIENALTDGDNDNIRMDGENNEPSVNEDSINSRIDEIDSLDPYHMNPELNAEYGDLQGQLSGIRNNGQEETEPTTNIPTEEFISNVPTEEPTEEKAFKGPKSEGKFMRALGAGTRVATPILGNVAKGVAKGTAMGIGAATLGTIGIAAGLASDDYSNVAKWGAAAAGIGGTLGSTASRLPSQAYRKTSTTLNNVKEQFQREYYTPAEYKQKQNERLDKEFMKDKEVQTKYRNEFGRDSYKKVMEQAKEYRRHGITDDDVIISAMKAKSKFATDNYADPRRIAAAKLVTKQVSNEKDIENMQKRLKEKGISNNQINDQSNMIRQILKIKY